MSESTTWTGTDASERFVGGPGDDVLNGTGGDDEILGGLGNDTIEGGSGADTIQGGGGNDLITDYDGILLAGGEGNDTITGGGGGRNNDVYGDAGDDTINLVESASTTTDFGGGSVYGGSGSDTLNIFSDAWAVYGDGFDYGMTSAGSLSAESGDDTITIEDATVFRVYAGDGSDLVVVRGIWGTNDGGFSPFDRIHIELDYYEATGGNDTLDASQFLAKVDAWGHAGNDTFIGQSDNFSSSFYGGEGLDRITGGGGNDYLHGGDGDDTIIGGSGNDTIGGGDGVDILTGGLGSDVFVYDFDGEGRPLGADATNREIIYLQPDIITDFTTGDSGDQLDFRPLFFILGYTGADPFGEGWLKLEQDGNDVLVKLDRSGSGSNFTETVARLQNTSASDFTTFNALPAGPLDSANNSATGRVTISGTATENQTLTAITSSIADADGLGTFSYQWLANGTPVVGATNRSYTLTQNEVGKSISVQISYTDGGGTNEALVSSATSAVTNVNDSPTGAVGISGTASEYQTLTAITSSIADEDGLGAFSYQWLRDGTPITGANSSSYTLSDDDIGNRISVQITFTDGWGTTETLTSAETAAVTAIVPETIVLTNTSDSYTGTDLPEIISVQGGDDTIIASKGNDTIDGGDGTDTVIYDGDQDAYTVTLGPSGAQVRDRRADGNGTDTLTNIEFLDFDTGDFANFNLDQFGGATSLNEADFKGFIELYIAYFNRAPDAVGLNFWGTAFANGTTMEQMAELFAPQDETLNTYPEGTSNTEFATAVYNNVLGRIPDQAGFDFWVGVLDGEWVTRDQFILEVLRGVQNGSPDRDYLQNKVDVGAYFAVHKGMSDTGNASAAMLLYDGTEASIQTVKQAIDAYHLEAFDPINGEFLMPLVGVLDDPFV